MDNFKEEYMRLFDCVMLALKNPSLDLVHQDLLKNYINYLDKEQARSCNWKGLVEEDPHVTLIYGLDPAIGRNKLYHTIKIQNRDEYNQLRSLGFISLQTPKIDIFDQGDYKVLKVNLKDSNGYVPLKAMSDRLMELPNTFKYGGDGYNPHLTLCYLKGDTPDSVIESINSKYGNLMDKFMIDEFIISGTEEGGKVADYQYRFL